MTGIRKSLSRVQRQLKTVATLLVYRVYRVGRIAVDGAAGTAVQPAARRVQPGFHVRGILGRDSPVALPPGQCLRPEKRLRLPAGRADAAALRSDDRLPHARKSVRSRPAFCPTDCRFSPSDCATASRCRRKCRGHPARSRHPEKHGHPDCSRGQCQIHSARFHWGDG